MNKHDYLQLMLGQKYQLDKADVSLLITITSAFAERGIEVTFASAPIFGQLGNDEDRTHRQDLYKFISQGQRYWELYEGLRAAENNHHAIKLMRDVMNNRAADATLRKAGLVLVSEWLVPEEPAEGIADETAVTIAEAAAELRPAYNGWLATGKMELADEHGVKTIVDLDTPVEPDDAAKEPAVVSVGRLLRVTWDKEGGFVNPERMEAMAQLLGHMILTEREHFVRRIDEVRSQAKPAEVSLWPKNQDHWIYDPAYSVLKPGLELRSDHPSRVTVEEAVKRAAQFAMSRASGVGTSRVLNIEGFVNSVVLGLIGDGTSEKNFDVGDVFGRVDVVHPCTREHVGDNPAPRTQRAPRKPAADKPARAAK